MRAGCRSVQELIQEHFDSVNPPARTDVPSAAAELGLDAVAHLAACRRCRELFEGYRDFRAAFRREAGAALAELDPPDWDWILRARRRARPSTDDSAAARSRRADTGPSRRLSVVFLLVVFVVAAGFFGYRQYGLIEARSFVHSDTVAFVDSLFSAPFFPAATESPLPSGAGSSWFDGTNVHSRSPANASAETGGRGAPAPPGS